MKLNMDSKLAKYVLLAICVALMAIMYFQKKTRSDYEQAKQLPYFNTKVEEVQDGTYTGKITTNFLKLQLDVSVLNHKITDIQIVEKNGSRGKNVDSIIQAMIDNNTSLVPAIAGEELASLVFISCCDDALRKGTPDYVTDENNKN